ncbi:catechol 2,3-dioxygenase-like lactoylglutathione lyase family enzyme [Nocardia neocaledoniensis]|uniref:Catechol 2,3-dioxygenase-like lactoylglutathione lyase family enzyme n=1 Tax=Nocardia neocaledoniensis TaxID=236511 RepID=A0A317P289_9NOCA|nr:catechol 2,3-dioxygenase-like lactoylglutathione lyase family enzyme [Nocardia neocaledoniensis]
MIRIGVTSVFVDDQDKAEKFYTDVLGFQVKDRVPLGEFDWLTLVSPADVDGTQLLLEPDQNPIAQNYKTALTADGIPCIVFTVDDLEAEYRRLLDLGVLFTQPPQPMGAVTTAVFDDTCGNLIQLMGAPATA